MPEAGDIMQVKSTTKWSSGPSERVTPAQGHLIRCDMCSLISTAIERKGLPEQCAVISAAHWKDAARDGKLRMGSILFKLI